MVNSEDEAKVETSRASAAMTAALMKMAATAAWSDQEWPFWRMVWRI